MTLPEAAGQALDGAGGEGGGREERGERGPSFFRGAARSAAAAAAR